MSYVVPQVKVYQEFAQAPAAIANPLYAFIFGPNYQVVKYSDGEGYLGQYDENTDTAYSWPSRAVGAVVDQSYTSVTVKDALLRYYSNTSGDDSDEIINVLGYNNRIRAEAISFKDNPDDATTYPRSTDLPDRDVAIGDIARVYGNVGGTTYEVWTRVTGILPNYVSATIGSATHDTSNFSDLSAGNDAAANVGTGGGVRAITGASVSGYDGLTDGYPEETYTITITSPSSGGTGALATVVSASGTDDASDVAIVASSQVIGTRGATFNWGGSGDWYVGDQWVLTVRQNYDVPTLATAGEYDSSTDTTYILEVTKGGASGTAEVSVSTTNGYDVSGPHVVTSGTAIAIGTKGVEVTFSSFTNGLYKGAQFYVVCTGETAAGYNTLVLADDLPAALRAESHPGFAAGGSSSSSNISRSDLNLKLFVKKTITLPEYNYPDAPAYNWTQSATQITLESGAKVYDSDFLDDSGNSWEMVLEADTDGLYSLVYVTYRALLQTYASGISSLDDSSDVSSTLGEVTTDNPLALGVYYALRNSNGTAVKFMAVPTNDSTGYSAVLDKATGRRDLYSFVPTTRNATIQNLVASHVEAMSTETKGQWRICFLNGLSSSVDALVDVGETYPLGGSSTYVAADLLATIGDDPDASGTQYTLVTWDSSAYPAGGGFVDMGVRAGDLFRTNYTGDGYGGSTYDDYVVDAVLSNQTLRLVSGPSTPITVARKFSVQKSYTKNEEASAYAAKTAAFTSRRVYYIWPDVIEDAAGTQIEGFYTCAAIAGLISAVVPQQGLTNVEIQGFSAVTRTTQYFSESQLDTMAEAGVWIIDQDPDTAEIYTRHELSTCTTDLNCKELMIVKNVDSISYIYLNQLRPYIGRSNVTPRFLAQLRRQILSTADYLKANGSTPTLGGQLISAEIVELRQHTVNLDQIVVVMNIDVPEPANVIELKLVV